MNTQMLERSILFRQSKEEGHPFRVLGVVSAKEHSFNEIAMQARTQSRNRQFKTIRASHGPRVSPQAQTKEKVKRTMGNPPEGSFRQAKVQFKFLKT